MQEVNTLNNLDKTDHSKFSGLPENVQVQLTRFLDLMKWKFNDPCWESGALLQQKGKKKSNAEKESELHRDRVMKNAIY